MKTIRLITVISTILLQSCSYITNPQPFAMYYGMTDGAPDGTPEFRAGFKDGCETGMAAYGTLHYKATHGFRYDDRQLNNDEYHAAWRIGFRHCRWYTAEWTR